MKKNTNMKLSSLCLALFIQVNANVRAAQYHKGHSPSLKYTSPTVCSGG